jgi:predicted enzyme related to lactoylglutathione lyase
MAVTLGAIVFDCADITAASTFYSELTGWPIESVEADWIDLRAAPDVLVSFQLAPNHVPPQWPDPNFPQQAHLDLVIPLADQDALHERAISLGATALDAPEGSNFRVYADPAGHPFCLCAH